MSSLNSIEALERLARLHNDGKLTDAEFAEQKAALLAADRDPGKLADPAGQDQWRTDLLLEAQDIKQDLRENWGCLSPVGFSLLYLFFLLPTYALPYRGSNSLALTSWLMDLEGTSFAEANPYFFVHAACLSALILLAGLRGRLIGKRWIITFPIIAGAFDLAPGLSMIPMVPTGMHVLALIFGNMGSIKPPTPIEEPENYTFHVWGWSLALLAMLSAGYWLLTNREGLAGSDSSLAATNSEPAKLAGGMPELPSALTAEWLIGTWGPAELNPRNDPLATCETDVVLDFEPGGSYSDAGSSGRYETDGRTIRYFDRLTVPDPADDPNLPFREEPLSAFRVSATIVDQNTFSEDGDLWRRCLQPLVDAWYSENETCRGGSGDDPATWEACSNRERTSAELERKGWCYGDLDAVGFERSWALCTP